MHWPPKIAALLIAALLAPTVFGFAHAQERRGRALFKEYCASCHAIGKTGHSPMQSAVPFRVLGRSFDLDEFPRLLRRGISSTHPGDAGVQVRRRRRPRGDAPICARSSGKF